MNAEIPKQFLLLNGEPVLIRTIRTFHQYDPWMDIIITLPADQVKYWHTLCENHNFNIPHTVVEGGETRHHSVKNTLSKIPTGSLVAIHDGVRPLLSNALIRTCFDTAAIMGNAVPVTELSDSIREIQGENNKSADRQRFRLVQTPQVFHSDLLIDAFRQDYDPKFTDEAALIETAGHKIHMVKGQPENIKITTSLDLYIASAILDNC